MWDWAELRSRERRLFKVWLRAQMASVVAGGNAVEIRRWRIIVHNVLPEWERDPGE